MTMHGRIEMWSLKTLIAASTLGLLVGGCAGSKGAEKAGRAPLPDEEGEGWTPGEKTPAGAKSAEVGQADIPLAKKKSGRQVSEDVKADFEKAAADYQAAKKNGPLSPSDCGSLAGTFRKLADKNPTLLEARNN